MYIYDLCFSRSLRQETEEQISVAERSAAMKKIVIKVAIYCQICKRDAVSAVTKLTGINEISVDEEKRTLTIIGDVDPVLVVKRLAKKRKYPELVSVGPPKPPEPEKPKPKPKPPQSDPPCPCLPPSCKNCKLVAVAIAPL